MQELNLLGYHSVLSGGSSKPILINALNEIGEDKTFVMKTYRSNFIEENFSIAKEILVTILAREFDLPIPEYGLIKIDNTNLREFYSNDEVNLIDTGYKFCTEFHEGYVIMNTALAIKKILKDYEIETLFAFDNLIMNVDRGGFRNKPNLLIRDEDFLLIDHEQTLPFYNSFEKKKDFNFFTIFNNFYYQNHIFWSTLKSFDHKKKQNLFDEFIELLRTLNINNIKLIFSQMEKFGILFGDKDAIFAYINWAKVNYSYISKVLKNRIK
ncbi:hypothetical protein EG240_11740 [Paenimyroides tangerinum]|uniref:HipA-like kinase domain-containing protein n=1 Tax=Paenimyroides tangerinum TaxID=2488728 RepID=A0A3P3W9T5_9FLAO|nr:HipA family kinase [Paenimyroides tangerinum]RRJ89413.1 hypothetical protein EG240_11740 [Paenimyroides tangerinum]